MAEVYLAVQSGPERFAKLVVQKRVRGAMQRRPDLVRGFLAEARLLARLSHPNLVQVLDLGWDERGPFVVVEYLSGETLSTVLREMVATAQIVPWPIVTRVAAGLASGLAAAHGNCDGDGRPDPMLHRDLTPSNVIVCYSGAAKIIDFGIAKLAAESGDTRAGMIKGKLSYLAPELLRGATASRASDLFQLGVLLFETLTGRRLFDGPNDAGRVQAVLHRPIPAPTELVPGLPVALDRLVLGLLARDPDQRIADAEQARGELEEVLRRSGQHVGEHEVSAWMRGMLPRQFVERVRRERECLRALAPLGRPPPLQVGAPAARWRRMAVAASLAVLVGASAVAIVARSSEPVPGAETGAGTANGEGEGTGEGTGAATAVDVARSEPVVSPLVAPPVGGATAASGTREDRAPAVTKATAAPVRRPRRRPRRSEPGEPAVYIPLPRAAVQAPGADAGTSPDAGPSRGGGSQDPRTDNLDPWNR
jgi:eukaryotic-like serine/threonine-protein kinase